MKDNYATYRLVTDSEIIEFESNLPVVLFQEFLRRNDNRFKLERFIKFIGEFNHIKSYFINQLTIKRK